MLKTPYTHLLPKQVREILGEERSDEYMRRAEQQTENSSYPRLQRHHGVRQENHEDDMPSTLRRHFPRTRRIHRQREPAKSHQKEQHHVADPQQVGVLHESRIQEAQQQREQYEMGEQVDHLRRGRLDVDQPEISQDEGQQDE